MSANNQIPLSHDIIIEMLEVFTHNLLYVRRIYPLGIFQKRSMYNCLVYQSRYPPLNEYISNALTAAHCLLKAGTLQKFEIVFSAYTSSFGGPAGAGNGGGDDSSSDGEDCGQSQAVLRKIEAYCVECVQPANATAATDDEKKRMAGASRIDNLHREYDRLNQFEENMRSVLLSIDAYCKNMPDLPERVAFTVHLHTSRTGMQKLVENQVLMQEFPWINQEVDYSRVNSLVPLAEMFSCLQLFTENYS